jgi:DNA-binding NarL/FixJ family response regulator
LLWEAKRAGVGPAFSTGHKHAQSSLITEIAGGAEYIRPTCYTSSFAMVSMTNQSACSPTGIRVLLADSKPMENQLLADSLKERGFQVFSCPSEAPPILELLESGVADVAVISSADPHSVSPDLGLFRTLHLMCPEVPKICLMDIQSRELAVQAFRSGARGLFCLADLSFQSFCDCIERVHRGEIFATNQQLSYLLDSVCQLPSLRVIGASGEILLTSREEQVVALVTDGLSNRDVANELGLSEHTVKKYLFRIFEKLGISSRVELVLYALHHGSSQVAGWGARA